MFNDFEEKAQKQFFVILKIKYFNNETSNYKKVFRNIPFQND